MIGAPEERTMVSSNRQTFACTLLLLAAVSLAHAQKDQTASISGKVTLKNKGVAGVVVVAVPTNYSGNGRGPRYRGTTDAEGNYRIDNIATGSYHVTPMVRAFVIDRSQTKQLVAVTAGDAIRDIDFALVRGGVITGKITGADGQPLIEENVDVMPVDFSPDYDPFNYVHFQTDDRGVYRVYGLRQGKYRISVGGFRNKLPGETRPVFKQTFYPSVTDPEKAVVLEVSEGGELRNVDIEVEPPLATFKVTGRIIDGETGKPIARVAIGLERTDDNSSVSTTGAAGSNENGEIKLEHVMPGHYKIFAASLDKSDWRADPVTFDVVDSDVTGLEIKTRRAATLSGVVVLQNYDDKSVAPRLTQIQIFAMVEPPGRPFRDGSGAQVAADGSFKIGGLVGGNVQLTLSLMEPQIASRDIEIVSVEQDGVPQPKGIDLKNGEQMSGIRVLARYNSLTGAIHGQVNFENGEPPPGTESVVSVRSLDEKPSAFPFSRSGHSAQLDSRGRFLIGQLGAGVYEVTLTVVMGGQAQYYKQQVTVTNNAVSEVTIPVKLKP